MSSCFTCSRTEDPLSSMTNVYWDILKALLFPQVNIDHLCFANQHLLMCEKCMKTLHCVSVFRDVAVNCVRQQIQHWNESVGMKSTNSLTETDEVDVKSERVSPLPPDNQDMKQKAILDDIMVVKYEPEEFITCDIKIENGAELPYYGGDENELLAAVDMDDQSQASDDVYLNSWLKSGASCDTDQATETTEDQNYEINPEPEKPKCRKTGKNGTKEKGSKRNTTSTGQRKLDVAFTNIVLNKKGLRAYRCEQREKPQFVRAKYKCRSCIVTFDKLEAKKRHIAEFHKPRKTECGVCRQTMAASKLIQHLTAHYSFTVCSTCEYKTDNLSDQLTHMCGRKPDMAPIEPNMDSIEPDMAIKPERKTREKKKERKIGELKTKKKRRQRRKCYIGCNMNCRMDEYECRGES